MFFKCKTKENTQNLSTTFISYYFYRTVLLSRRDICPFLQQQVCFNYVGIMPLASSHMATEPEALTVLVQWSSSELFMSSQHSLPGSMWLVIKSAAL